jgi:deazaflavin-dependent oxidoreductase (nitroreductase family)
MDDFLRFIFRQLNKFFMVPAFRWGFGRFVGTPFGGYIMVLKTIGRKTGLVRYAPVNYALMDGKIYCLSGFGKIAHWYKNIQAQPQIDIILPSATLSGTAATVTDQDEWLTACRQILKNSGFAGFLAGFNAWTISDDDLRTKGSEMIVLRITPNGIFAGAADPGGKLWLWLTLAAILIVAGILLHP